MTNKNINIESRQNMFWLLICILALILGTYFYFIHQSVAVVVSQKTIKKLLSESSVEIVRLESIYNNVSGKITMEMAIEKGFVDPTFDSSFAYLNNPERLVLGRVSDE